MDTRTADAELNRLIETGRPMDGFERFYAESVTMQENLEPPRVGKAENRSACQAHLAAVRDLQMTLLGSAVDSELSFSEWRHEYRTTEGESVTHLEVAVRRWVGGQIIAERFYYPS